MKPPIALIVLSRKHNINRKEIKTMRIKKFYLVLTMLITLGALFQLPARADESRETTKITFSAPVEIPGQALPAGTYIFERLDDNDFRDMVQIYNADHTVLYAILQTNAVDRMNPTGDPAVTLAQQSAGTPDALVRWFYPGTLTGHEFIYPKAKEKALTQAKLDTFIGDKLVSGDQAAGE
jgi:hypothetical protein